LPPSVARSARMTWADEETRFFFKTIFFRNEKVCFVCYVRYRHLVDNLSRQFPVVLPFSWAQMGMGETFHVGSKQGDQIGRFFAYFVVIYLRHFFESSWICQTFWTNFFHGKSCVLMGLGDFFRNSSGHPVSKSERMCASNIIIICSGW
jgi:hypothetical protein